MRRLYTSWPWICHIQDMSEVLVHTGGRYRSTRIVAVIYGVIWNRVKHGVYICSIVRSSYGGLDDLPRPIAGHSCTFQNRWITSNVTYTPNAECWRALHWVP